jgi:hypothetical protein
MIFGTRRLPTPEPSLWSGRGNQKNPCQKAFGQANGQLFSL